MHERSNQVLFSKLIYKIPYDFLKINFSYFTPYVRLNLKFRIQKCEGERNKKNLTFPENNTVALEISESLKFPWDDRTDTNFIAPLRRKPSLVASENWQLRGFSILQNETNSKV